MPYWSVSAYCELNKDIVRMSTDAFVSTSCSGFHGRNNLTTPTSERHSSVFSLSDNVYTKKNATAVAATHAANVIENKQD